MINSKQTYYVVLYLLHALTFLIFCCPSFANISVLNYRIDEKPQFTRFVIDLSGRPDYHIFTLSSPNRIVIDVQAAQWQKHAAPFSLFEKKRITDVRYSTQEDQSLRIVLDLQPGINLKEAFILGTGSASPYRLVIDVEGKNHPLPSTITTQTTASPASITSNIPIPQLKPLRRRKPVIVIDAGHGGHDPGAIGYRNTHEKKVTLNYAYALRRSLTKLDHYKVFMTRYDDRYVGLYDRVKKAQAVKGDLFISLHADAHNNRKIKGLSIYTLSEKASDKEAETLAKKENKSGIIGQLDLAKENNELTNLFIDLVQRDTKNISAAFAESLVENLENRVRLLRRPHRFAGFRVLTGPDIPSVLIELGYLSNKEEEKLLQTTSYQEKVINGITVAIDKHFAAYPVD